MRPVTVTTMSVGVTFDGVTALTGGVSLSDFAA
jgi:hypothetical protein